MEYVYIISNIFLLISALAVKKKPEKMNFLPTSIIIIVLYFCYNAMIAYLLNIVHLRLLPEYMILTD